MNVCMGDCSVRPLAAGMDRLVWWALVTPAGGEKIGNPEPLADIALALAARHDEHVPPEIGGATPERGEIGSCMSPGSPPPHCPP